MRFLGIDSPNTASNQQILFMGQRLQMRRIHTAADSTFMIQFIAKRNLADELLAGPSMGGRVLAIDGDTSVAAGVYTAYPEPTPRVRLGHDFLPKSLKKR